MYGDFFKSKQRVLTKRGVLWLGQTCNIRCHFCYFLDRIEDSEHPEHAFMDLSKAKQICDTLRLKYKNDSIDIQGGEPMVYKDINELVAHCHQIGLHPTLITNAMVLSKESKLIELKESGIRDLLVSVHGIGEVYDNIVGTKGASDKQLKALELCVKHQVPIRFNCVLSKAGIPQYIDVARLAIKYNARAVTYLAFNPFEDQSSGHRSTDNVGSYSEVASELNKALDVLDEAGIEANVRYFPLCMVEERHREKMYNFQQLSYDPHEWDFDSWTWTGQQPQRMKWGDCSPTHESLEAATYYSWIFKNGEIVDVQNKKPSLLSQIKVNVNNKLSNNPRLRKVVAKTYHAMLDLHGAIQAGPIHGDGVSEISAVVDPLGRSDRLYRDHAMVRAYDHCNYRYADVCKNCDAKKICDGFHGDYADIYGTDEAAPIKLTAGAVNDPCHFIRGQSKVYEFEDYSFYLGAAE